MDSTISRKYALTLTAGANTVTFNENVADLSRMEFRLMEHLVKNAGRTVSKDELMRSVWETSFYSSTKTIDVHLGWLRRKLSSIGVPSDAIETLRGRGLRYIEPA